MRQPASTPPSRGRPREFDPDAVIERAMNAFWSAGYHGTSLPDLLDATRLSRGSLYAAFGDKHGLFLLALDRYIADALARLDTELDPRRPALAGLKDCLAGYIGRTSGVAGKRGCLVIATAMELATHDTEAASRIRCFFDTLHTRLTATLQRAQTEGDITDGADPATVARLLVCVFEGMRVVGKTGLDPQAATAIIQTLLDRFTR